MQKIVILFTLFLITPFISICYAQSTSTYTIPDIKVTPNQNDLNEVGEINERAKERAEEDEELYSIEDSEIISQKILENRNVDNLSEILQDIPGVNVSGGASPKDRKVSIRGMSGHRVIQKVDGAKRYESTQQAFSSDIGIEPESLVQVQVQKGAESLANASGAIGGAILYRTLNPSDMLKGKKETSTKAKVAYSSASKSTAQNLTTAAQVTRDTGILLQAIWRDIKRTQSGGDEEESSELDYLRQNYMAKIENKSVLGKVIGKASYTRTRQLNTTYLESYPEGTTDYDDITTEATLNHTYSSPSNTLLNLKNSFSINRRRSDKETHEPVLGRAFYMNSKTDRIDQMSGEIKNRSLLSLSKKLFLESEIGLNYAKEEMDEQDNDDPSLLTFYGKSQGHEQGVFLMNNLNLYGDRIILKAGGRYNKYKRNSEKLAIHAKESKGDTFSNLIGLTIKPLPFVDLFAKLSNSNRAPEVRELYIGGGAPFSCHWPRKTCRTMPNSNLREENAYGREVGINFHHKFSSLTKANLKVNYFYEKIGDYIERMPMMYKLVEGRRVLAGPREATHREYKNLNLNNVLRAGIEAEFNLHIKNFNFKGKYSSMNMDCSQCPVMFSASTISEPLYTAPADKLLTTLEYTISPLNLNFGYRGQFVAAQERLSQRYIRAGYSSPGYSVHNAFIGWEPTFQSTGTFRIDMSLENFTNKKYKVHNSGSGSFELGQNFRMSLSKFF